MATETVNHPATVLTHPAFDRPPVENQRGPGQKKGTLSMAKARRHRIAAMRGALRIEPAQAHERPSMAPTEAPLRPAAALPTPPRLQHEEAVIAAALAILESRLRAPGGVIGNPGAVKRLLRLHLAELEREVFGVLFLDTRHASLGFEIMFEGTLAHTSVHPREIARRALELNAAAVVMAHNHPSGIAEPSRADELVTQGVRVALQLVDVRVLDHVIVGRCGEFSFAERGLL